MIIYLAAAEKSTLQVRVRLPDLREMAGMPA